MIGWKKVRLWEFMRPSKRFGIDFGGHIYFEDKNVSGIRLKKVTALAYDQMIPGYKNDSASTLRLWSAHGGELFDLAEFNRGDHFSGGWQRVQLTKTFLGVLYQMILPGMVVSYVYVKSTSWYLHLCKIFSVAI